MCNLHFRRDLRDARRPAAHPRAVPGQGVGVREQGAGRAGGEAHGPGLRLLVALVALSLAAFALLAVLKGPRAALLHPVPRRPPAAGRSRRAHAHDRAVPGVAVRVYGVGAARHAVGLAGRPALGLLVALFTLLLAALCMAAVLPVSRAVLPDPGRRGEAVVRLRGRAGRPGAQLPAGPEARVVVRGVPAGDALGPALRPLAVLRKARGAGHLAAARGSAVLVHGGALALQGELDHGLPWSGAPAAEARRAKAGIVREEAQPDEARHCQCHQARPVTPLAEAPGVVAAARGAEPGFVGIHDVIRDMMGVFPEECSPFSTWKLHSALHGGCLVPRPASTPMLS
mmetsp:Transcript_12917/g.36825  ORF Transcript_12917/g.36825 Transcript_12917/m.36825 type:complete len:342 (-) Transcript_12917:19-1044(-)